jgi:hypothetical protein
MQASMSKVRILLLGATLLVSAAWQTTYAAEPATSQASLVSALSKSKLTLADAIRDAATKGGAVISAKFEFDDAGKLSLSVYTAEKGLSVAPEENVLQEVSGSPEQSPWKKEVEVFKDVPHVARAAEQLTLLALSHRTLLDVIANAQKKQPGTVFSISPALKEHKAVAVVLIASNGKVTELSYDLQSGALLKTRHL